MPGQDTYVKLPTGSYVRVPADATPDQLAMLRARLRAFSDTKDTPTYDLTKGFSKATGLSAQPSYGPIGDRIEGLRQRLEQSVTSGSSPAAGEFMGSLPLGLLKVLRGVAQGGPINPTGLKDMASGSIQAATIPSLVAGVPEAIDAIPSSARAAERFENVMQTASNVPIPTTRAAAIAQRGQELASRGGQLPKILGDFVDRMKNTENPLTYKEARDFYTNARLAMSEFLQTKPNMWRQVTMFKQALGDAIKEGLQPTGQLSEYTRAMAEYRRAQILGRVAQTAARIGIPAAIGYKLNKLAGSLAKAAE